ncbi:hypothetical protein [Streptomyces sp. NRRL B-24484]|uniref:hypothetical protein n=1 Tax=Streptomyces sp. NRRL B-24484 TaxID=1463833 RepID=UPI0004BF4AC2|nr:hypothetical protein [Streptomyces sp. NRRL B-24484]
MTDSGTTDSGTADGGTADADASLLAAARQRLRAGAAPTAVCGELAARTHCWWEAASAVGRAAGIPEPELRRRLHGEPAQVQRALGPGEEEAYGELLSMLGVFDVHEQLDGRAAAIAEHLRTAVAAMGGVASGHALGLSRRMAEGELTDAFRSLARLGPRARGGRPTAFWAALVTAGELLDPADREESAAVTEALAKCRVSLERCTGEARTKPAPPVLPHGRTATTANRTDALPPLDPDNRRTE